MTTFMIASFLLGALAFFEPCTVATHTLFAARLNRASNRARWRELGALLATRAILLSFLFGGAALVRIPPLLPKVAVALLGAAGLIYLVSRVIYIPVPHLELFRVFGGGERLSRGAQLGLTLPACTLPLVLVVIVLSAIGGQVLAGVAAGLLFALMFSLPTLLESLFGFSPSSGRLLSLIASAAPYATAGALWGAAAIVWVGGM